MNCPNCKGPFSIVTKTDYAEGERIERQRECIVCGFHFGTVELYDGYVAQMTNRAAIATGLISDRARQKARAIIEERSRHNV
jgi:transcriptional regulator NrdR family protein